MENGTIQLNQILFELLFDNSLIILHLSHT